MHKNRFTEKLEVVGDKYRIVEKMILTPIKSSTISEKVIFEGKEINAHKKYTFRIWDDKFNANERNYANVIDEVIEKNLITYGLADHPEENCESVKDICMVEKNPRKIDGWMCVDGYPIGEYGRRIEEILDVGGGIEVSSSVLGDIDDDGYIMKGVETERYFDWVLNCSNRQIQFTDHIEQREDDKIDNINLVSETGCVQETKENVTIYKEDISVVKEHTDDATEKGEEEMAEVITEKVAEQAKSCLSLNVKSMFKEAKTKTDLYEKKELLESADLYAKQLEDELLTKEIEDELSATEDEIKELSLKGLETDNLTQTIDTLKKSNDELEIKCKKLEDEKNEIEEQLNAVTEMFESKQYRCSEKEISKSHNLSKEVSSLKIKSIRKDKVIESLNRKIALLERKLEKSEAEKNSMVDAETYSKVLDEKKSLSSKLRSMRIKSLHEEDETSDDRLASLKRKLKKFDDFVEEDEIVTEDETLANDIVEDDEDIAMEKMLAMDSEIASSEDEIVTEDDDALMTFALNR